MPYVKMDTTISNCMASCVTKMEGGPGKGEKKANLIWDACHGAFFILGGYRKSNFRDYINTFPC
jgi:hypothetical protein